MIFGPKYQFLDQNCTLFWPWWSLFNFFNTKKVSYWFPDMRVPKILAQERPNLADIGLSGPFDAIRYPIQCERGVLVVTYVGTKGFGPTPQKIG